MRLSVMAAAICLCIIGLASADDVRASIRRQTNIPAEGLGPALQALAKERNFQIVYVSEEINALHTEGAVGEFTAEEALKRLLDGTGYTYKYLDENTVTVVPLAIHPQTTIPEPAPPGDVTSSPTSKEAAPEEPKKNLWDRLRLAQVDQGKTPGAAPLNTTGQGTAVNAEKGTELNEIVVTATKRESTVQTTPISITAVTGADIQERGLVSLSEFAQSVPGVSMRTSGPGQTEFEMRGMASTGGNSATVGFYLDDVPLTAPATTSNGKVVIDPNLYDLNRIEVLRGPQGTLYGSGSMGGTIKVVTNAPNPALFETSGEVILGGTDGGGFNHGENAMVNIPLAGGTAALRIVGSYSGTSGWVDRIVTADESFPLETKPDGTVSPSGTVRGNVLAAPIAADYKNVNNEELTAGRATLLWKPTDRLTLTGSYLYQQIYQIGGYEDSVPGNKAHYQPFDAPEPFSDYFNLGSVDFKYHFDAFDLSSTTSHYTRGVTYHQDGAEEWQWALGLPMYTSQGGLGTLSPTPVEVDSSKQISEELRVTSSGDSRFQWLFGYFYDDFTSNQAAIFLSPGGAALFGTTNVFSFNAPTTIIQNSFFGELSYRLTSQLKVTVGARRYAYNESVTAAESGAVATGSDAVVYTYTSEHNQGLNPKFLISYEPNDSLLLYTTAAKGFRPGGGTGPVPTSGPIGATCEANLQSIYGTSAFVPGPTAFAPDNVWNYEIGEKLTALGNRLTLNSAVYFEQWNGIQQTIPLACAYNYTTNAGDAHVYGSEIELQGVLARGLILSANVGYTHATIASSNVLGVGVDPGTPVQDVPDWTSSIALSYRYNLTSDLAFRSRVENDYVGSRTDATYTINHLPSYDLASIRAGVETEQWSAIFFVNNLLNKNSPLNNITQISVNLPTYNRVVTTQPLTLGIDLNFRFGR